MSHTIKKSGSHILADVGIFAAGAAAAVAAGLFLYGKNAASNRKAVRGWVVKMKGEVLDEIERMGKISGKDYQILVDKVARRYAGLAHVGKKDLARIAKELKSQWKYISARLGQEARVRLKRPRSKR